MLVDAIETLHFDGFPNLSYVRIHTDDGLIGLGETFWGPETVAAHVHEVIAPYLLGRDPRRIEEHWQSLSRRGLATAGAEGRALSAVDIALWDVFGQSVGLPIYQAMGGASRDRIRVYNTCAGYGRGPDPARPDRKKQDNWGLGGEADGPYEDYIAMFEAPGDLARSLLGEGYTALKVWPFFSATGSRSYLTPDELERGLRTLRGIREAVGDQMDVMLELTGSWTLPMALRIAHAAAEYGVYWLEDPVQPAEASAWAEFQRLTPIPTAGGETLGGRVAFRALLENGVQHILLDPTWVGGFTEARKVAALVDAYQRPICPHDCTGPISMICGVHLCMHAPNAMIQEVVRAYVTGAYREIVTELPRVEDGFVYPLAGPGLGTALRPELFERADAHIRVSRR